MCSTACLSSWPVAFDLLAKGDLREGLPLRTPFAQTLASRVLGTHSQRLGSRFGKIDEYREENAC